MLECLKTKNSEFMPKTSTIFSKSLVWAESLEVIAGEAGGSEGWRGKQKLGLTGLVKALSLHPKDLGKPLKIISKGS